MLEDEITRRDQGGLARRIAQAHFEEVKTLEEFDFFGLDSKIPAQKIHDLAACHFVARRGIGRCLWPRGHGQEPYHPRAGTVHLPSRLSSPVRARQPHVCPLGRGPCRRYRKSRMRAYLHPGLLVVDDFSLRELSPQQTDDTFELVGERHRRSSMIIASNRTPQDWHPLFPTLY